MENLKFRKSLSVLENESKLATTLVESIREKMQGVNLHTLKYDPQFLVDICKCVDKNHKKLVYKKWTIENKNVVLKVYNLLYGDEVDMFRIESLIDFCEENDLIRRKSLLRLALEALTQFF